MSTATVLSRVKHHRKQSSSQANSISTLPVETILDILANAASFHALRTLLQLSVHNAKVMQVFMLNKDFIYTAIAKRQFTPLDDALAAASMATLTAPSNELDELDDPTAPLTLLSEREGNNKSLRVRDKGPDGLEERIQQLLVNDLAVDELQSLYEQRHGAGYKLSHEETASFRQSLYRIWAFTAGVPRFATRCVFDPEEVKMQYWEVRYLSRYSARDICEIGKVYSFLVGLVIECCRRCKHQEFFEPESCRNADNDEEYLSDVIGYHISKGPDAVLELYKLSASETNPARISRRLAWSAVGYQRFLIGDLEYVWYNKYGGLNFRKKSFRGSSKEAICS
ncbi:hypothetical protein Dda_0599 [Drechslerella dactyloides]|uniref:Uncharacterized protein n=1 Tax=Drechslerella dactyloides TaxID=74499 RepID=A0AAD6J4S6_DREDA|nr:hypothetical protein Dda_0599 [Drechslerella dactyloides]